MPTYRLKQAILAKRLDGLAGARGHEEARFEPLRPGDIIVSISSANKDGLVLVKRNGLCYRAWREDLRNSTVSERIDRGEKVPTVKRLRASGSFRS